MKLFPILVATGCVVAVAAWAQSGGYRGPQRDGIHPAPGLTTNWPSPGPRLLWRYPRQEQDVWNDAQSLGAGFCNVHVTNNLVFVAGLRAEQDAKNIYGFAFSLDGELKWATKLGKGLAANKYEGPRATPEYADGRVYFTSGLAEVFCVDARTGQMIWRVNTASLGNQVTGWGFNLSPLLADNKIIFPMRHSQQALVALDAATGKTVWTTPVFGDATIVDSSPVLFEVAGRKFVIQHLFRDVFAVDLATGALAWRLSGQMSTIMTPVVANGHIFTDINYQLTQLRPQLTDGKLTMEIVRSWKGIGGLCQAVVLGDRLFRVFGGSLQVIDLKTGEVVTEHRCDQEPRSLISADGKLFSINSDRTAPSDGKGQYREQALIQMFAVGPDGLKLLGSFKPETGTKEVYVAPVIAAGRLFHRHGSTLAVYDLRRR